MPGYDGTGPVGGGPGTGRGMGVCVPGRAPRAYGLRGPAYGRGMGWGAGMGQGRGPGRGFCRWWNRSVVPYYSPVRYSPEEEKAYLKDHAEVLKAELAEMEHRMAEIDEEKR